MSETTGVKADALPDLDDLLQCPVCYEIPSGQIFQCNEGHHVCGRCKLRLDVCPVCRALFFGTRNYAMEELIANVKKLRAFKLGGKITTGSASSECATPTKETTSEDVSDDPAESDVSEPESNRDPRRPPPACKGLFRCLCCKNGKEERLPSGRLLNHLRYFHSPELIESQSENGEYVQAWQISTVPGRIVTAIRISDMGIFFLIIEVSNDIVCTWLSIAAAPWVADEFCYTITISGNDREAIFSDSVWSVRSCEGSLRRRGHCLTVTGPDARALIAPASISGKLSVRRTPPDAILTQTQPRAVLRVANRGTNSPAAPHELEPFLQGLQNDVARLSRAFATLGREASALARSEAEMRARIEVRESQNRQSTDANDNPSSVEVPTQPPTENDQPGNERLYMSRNARRRMRQRLRAAFENPSSPEPTRPITAPLRVAPAYAMGVTMPRTPRQNGASAGNPLGDRPAPVYAMGVTMPRTPRQNGASAGNPLGDRPAPAYAMGVTMPRTPRQNGASAGNPLGDRPAPAYAMGVTMPRTPRQNGASAGNPLGDRPAPAYAMGVTMPRTPRQNGASAGNPLGDRPAPAYAMGVTMPRTPRQNCASAGNPLGDRPAPAYAMGVTMPRTPRQNGASAGNPFTFSVIIPPVIPPPVNPPPVIPPPVITPPVITAPASGPLNGLPQNDRAPRANNRRRRHRR